MRSDESKIGADGHADAEPLAIVTRAIDDLAAENPGSLSAAELTCRVASVWTLIGDIDPDLARRAARYEHPARDGTGRSGTTGTTGAMPDDHGTARAGPAPPGRPASPVLGRPANSAPGGPGRPAPGGPAGATPGGHGPADTAPGGGTRRR